MTKLFFLEEEKHRIKDIRCDYNLISVREINKLKCDILYVYDRNILKSFIWDINNIRHDLLETLEISFIILNNIDKLNKIFNNFDKLLLTKTDEDYESRNIYCFYRLYDEKFYTIIKNFKRFYFIEDKFGEYVTINNVRVSKCYDYNLSDIKHFERDISAFLRYSILKAKNNRIFLKGAFRIAYFDIETNACVDTVNTPGEILSIVVQDSMTGEVRKWVINPTYGDILEQEKSIIFHFFNYIKKFDAITGWNIMKFDMPYIINRANRLNIDTRNLSLVGAPVSCSHKKEDNINPWFIKVIGLNIFDMMTASVRALAYLPEKLKDNKLDTVAETILNENKIKTDTPAVLFKNNRIEELLEYNIQDVLLLMRLDNKIGISELLISTLDFVPGLNLENSSYNSKIIDYYLLYKFDIVFPSVDRNKISDVEGAIVYDPKSGIHKNVAVFDISGMYPALIRNLNISPDTITNGDNRNNIIINTTRTGKIIFSTAKIGILVKLIEDFQLLRNKYKTMKKEHVKDVEYKLWELRELATKKILSSVYGVFGFSGFRLFDNRIANSITTAGRELLNHMSAFAEKNGYSIICGDTDSIFIRKGDEDNREHFDKFIIDMNNSLEEYMKIFTDNDFFIKRNNFLIEYETLFDKVIIAPAKKKYIGIASKIKGINLEKPVLFGKGNELVKKDVPKIIKDVLRNTINHILFNDLEESDIIKYLRDRIGEVREEIKKVKFSDLLIYKEINREFNDYKVKPQHVRAAEDTNRCLGTDFSRQNYRGGLLYVNSKKYLGVEVLFLDPNYDFKQDIFTIDYDKYINKFFIDKINLIFGSDIYNKVIYKKVNMSFEDFLNGRLGK